MNYLIKRLLLSFDYRFKEQMIFFIAFKIIISEDVEINYVVNNDNLYDLNSFYIITKITFTINQENLYIIQQFFDINY